MLTPLSPSRTSARVALGIAFFVLFVAAWGIATFGGFVSKTFLADPLTMLREGWTLLRQARLRRRHRASRSGACVGGFVLAAAIAVPLGIAMGAYKPIEAFFEPFVSFARYLPASAFIPLLILWAGIGEMQKLLVIFIGSFFQIVLMVAVSSARRGATWSRRRYTLGAQRPRHRAPRAAAQRARRRSPRSLRLVLGWAWTYVIVAELIGASSGIGHMITDSQALLNTGQIIFGIIVIGVIGLISDFVFKWANQRLFPWSLADDEQARDRGRRAGLSRRARRRADAGAGARSPSTSPTTTSSRSSGRRAAASRRCCASSPASTRRRPAASLLDGAPVTAPGADRGMVFQSYTLFPWLTVRENICFGLREKGVRARAARRSSAHYMARTVGLERLRASLSEDALGRHAAAHGDRARARQRSQDPAARRAVRRARQPDARADAGAAARHLGGRAQDRAVRHARHRGGDLHGEPRRRDERAARAASRPRSPSTCRIRATTRSRRARVLRAQGAAHRGDPRRGGAGGAGAVRP